MSSVTTYQQTKNHERLEALFLKLNTLSDHQCTHALAELMGRLDTMSKNQFGTLSDETLSVVIGALEGSVQNQTTPPMELV